jgi:hypothetical protein
MFKFGKPEPAPETDYFDYGREAGRVHAAERRPAGENADWLSNLARYHGLSDSQLLEVARGVQAYIEETHAQNQERAREHERLKELVRPVLERR